MPYTGTIIVKQGYREICPEKDSLINMLFGCNYLLYFALEDGNVMECRNMSQLCQFIQGMGENREKIIGKQSQTYLQELFQRDYNENAVQDKNELYKCYMEYFEK